MPGPLLAVLLALAALPDARPEAVGLDPAPGGHRRRRRRGDRRRPHPRRRRPDQPPRQGRLPQGVRPAAGAADRRGHDRRHPVRPGLAHQAGGHRHGGDAAGRTRQAAPRRPGGGPPAGLRGQRQGARYRRTAAAAHLRPARRQPGGRLRQPRPRPGTHRRHASPRRTGDALHLLRRRLHRPGAARREAGRRAARPLHAQAGVRPAGDARHRLRRRRRAAGPRGAHGKKRGQMAAWRRPRPAPGGSEASPGTPGCSAPPTTWRSTVKCCSRAGGAC